MTIRMLLPSIYLLCLSGLPLLAQAGADTKSPVPLEGGVIAVWLQSPAIDREAILKLPMVKGGQVVVQWAQVEPEKGKYDFSALEEQLAAYAKRKLPVTVQLNGNQKPHYLFNEVPYVKETGRDVPAFQQVKNPEGTLMFWHPAHERAYINCLVAFRDYLAKSPYKTSIVGLRMNFNPFGTEGINIFPQQKAAEYASKERWIQPPGLDRSLPYDGFQKAEALNYVRRIIRKHIELFSGVAPMFIRCTVDSEVLREFSEYLDNGTFGIFETGASLAPSTVKCEEEEQWIYRYCRNGRARGYAESISDSWGVRGYRDDLIFAPPQAFYWRVLCDLHKGVSYIACYGNDLNVAVTGTYGAGSRTSAGQDGPLQYSDRQSGFNYKQEFYEALAFADKYAGYHARPEQAPGAWIAFREDNHMATVRSSSQKLKLPCFLSDYSYLMERLPDQSVGVTKIGPNDIRYGAYARCLPAHAAMHLKADARFLQSLGKGGCRVRVIYFDDAPNGSFSVSAAGQTWKAPLRGSKAWDKAVFEPSTSTFPVLPDGSQITIQNGDSPLCLHMLAVERK
jgi:hypothetical protein